MKVFIIEIGFFHEPPHNLIVASSVKSGVAHLHSSGWVRSRERVNRGLWEKEENGRSLYARFRRGGCGKPIVFKVI